MQMAAFLVEEGLAVGNQKLEVADLRLIDSRKIKLVEDAGRGGEPQSACRRVCGTDHVLGAAGPSRRDAGCAGGDGGCHDSCHGVSVRLAPRSDNFWLLRFGSWRGGFF